MPETSLSTTVNPFFAGRLLALAEAVPVLVSEDIVDTQGRRLLVRGTRLATHHREALAQGPLRKLIEGSLIVPDAPDTAFFVARAQQLLDSNLPLARIADSVGGRGEPPLALLKAMDFGHAMRLLLALNSREHAAALDHCVTVSLLAICVAKKLHLSDDDQHAAGLAGLLHDVGQAHVDPAALTPNTRLAPQAWIEQLTHPRIGQMLVDQLASYSLSVGRAVGEHHERFDGSGYPRGARGHTISAPGQAVSAADMIAALLYQDYPLERAELALRFIPGEHAPDLLSALCGALRAQGKSLMNTPAAAFNSEDDQRLYWRISSATETARKLLDGGAADLPRHRDLLKRALDRVATILRAYLGTPGVDKAVVRAEVQWRLRETARELVVQGAPPSFAPLLQLLDDGPAPGPASGAFANGPATPAGLAPSIPPANRPYLM